MDQFEQLDMEKIIRENSLIDEKQLNELDKFAIDFASILNNIKVPNVLVSGYVSILFGRSRSSEDIDIIVSKLTFDQFEKLWKLLMRDFECISSSSPKTAYFDYLLTGHAIRFAKKNRKPENVLG